MWCTVIGVWKLCKSKEVNEKSLTSFTCKDKGYAGKIV